MYRVQIHQHCKQDSELYREVLQEIDNQERVIYAEATAIIENYDDKKTTAQELSLVKDYYLKKKYLLRIRENISKFATQ